MEKKNISISRAKRILGKSGEGLSDEQMELLISQCYVLAEVMFEHFRFMEISEKKENKNDKN